MHTDGLSQLSMLLTPRAACSLADIQLASPLSERATRLINGFNHKGSARPDSHIFRWDEEVEHNQRGLNCRIWLGGGGAGLQINLQGVEQARAASASHCGQDDSGVLRCSDLLAAQCAGGRSD